ncbi:MAG: YciI family protein [bacterium]|nr:YciI family protein [bacterium]
MKFMCLAYEEESQLDVLSQSEWDALRRETIAYVDRLRAGGHLLTTYALQRAGTAATVRRRDGKRLVTDGPFAEAKEIVGGFFLIEARDREEALALAADWPSARFGAIEVRPVEEALPEATRYR